MARLLDQFVCVRLVQLWGVDISLFQFDGMQTWAVFFLNADKTIYGRYGSRGAREVFKDVSLEGAVKAVEAALELHKNYPANRAALAGKTGPAAPWPTTEQMPAFAGRFQRGNVTQFGCIHCHNVDEGRIKSAWLEKKGVPDRLLWSYPMPDVVGLTLDVQEKATVKTVRNPSAAATAGFKAGDQILRLKDQPLLSIADVQWLLHNAGDTAVLSAVVKRGGQQLDLQLALAEGWRRQGDFTWRGAIAWQIRPGFSSSRTAAGVRVNEPLFHVNVAGRKLHAAMAKAGLRKGDIVIAVAGQPVRSEWELIAAIWQKTAPGENFEVTVVRGEEKQTLVPP